MFASTLARLRDQSGMSQQQVADKLGVARATYTNLESGKRSPTLNQINAIAELFEVSPALLISNVEEASDNQNFQSKKVEFEESDNDIQPREIVEENPEVLREVLLYVLDKVGGKQNIGETVIYKLLYFIDFDYYEKTGKSITGLRYIRNHFGPTPTTTFEAVREAMEKKKELEVLETKYFSHRQKKYLPVIKPELKHLSAEQIKHIDEELARLSDKSAGEMTQLSHRDMPWMATKENQAIDYQLAMYRTSETSVKETEDEL